jgi:hypothetical protein
MIESLHPAAKNTGLIPNAQVSFSYRFKPMGSSGLGVKGNLFTPFGEIPQTNGDGATNTWVSNNRSHRTINRSSGDAGERRFHSYKLRDGLMLAKRSGRFQRGLF